MNDRDRPKRHWRGQEEDFEAAPHEPVDVFFGPPEQPLYDALPVLPGIAAGNRVALTFDDGPDEWTHDLLGILAENDVRATFFMVGEKVDRFRSSVLDVSAGGHEIANHTQTHANLSKLSEEEILEELADCSASILDATGSAPYFYRAPFLKDPPEAKIAGLALGMLSVDCDVIAEDWVLTDYREITNNVTRGVKDGGRLVLLHDGVPSDRKGSRTPTVKAVRHIVPWLKENGYELVTVSQLLHAPAQ